jgi:DNA-binding GntR family transcriptional regulator
MVRQSPAEVRGPARPTRELSRRQVLGDELYESLKEQIMDLRIAPRARLNIDQLARDFGVSSTPVRESLARLEAEGLLQRRALYGYFTTPVLSKGRLTELMGVRLIIEPAVASTAAQTIGEKPLALLQSLVDEMTRPSEQTGTTGPSYRSYRVFASNDALFHDTIAMEAGNSLLRSLLAGLHTHLHLYRLYFGNEIAPRAVEEHATIVVALRSHDPAMAASAMSTHINQALMRLLPMASDGE